MVRSENYSVAAGPNFINIGPGRCASSWLLEVLEAHPEIGMAKIKETEFFNTNFERGYPWYESLFAGSNGQVIGEISNCYYTQPEVAGRILEYDPGAKIIINVRDPFALLNSFHGFGLRRGLPLSDVENDLDFHVGKVMGSGYEHRAKKGTLNSGDTESLLDAVMLARHLRPFFDGFPPDQIYVFIFERLKTQSAEVVQEIYRFLEVDESFQPPVTGERVNEAIAPKSKMLGQAAMNCAFFLRQMGAYRILDQLKKSRLVKKIFYSKTGATGKKVNLRETLPNEVCQKIEDQMRELIALHPPLADWWNPLLGTSKESR
jgi:hypothetical protein